MSAQLILKQYLNYFKTFYQKTNWKDFTDKMYGKKSILKKLTMILQYKTED